ncbi:TlpA disulfide reductase family protein [Clostridium sp. CTA-5]
MKKIITLCLIGIMSLSLVGCGSTNKSTSNTGNETAQETKGTFSDLISMPKFEVKDIDDNVVTNDIFTNKNLTMINIWGTFCSPCIEEMPILQELSTEYEGKGVNVIGVVADGEENEVGALKMLKKLKVNYTNLIPNEAFKKDFVSKTNAVPVTVFVNNKGEILETVVGDRNKEQFKQLIENHLNNQK